MTIEQAVQTPEYGAPLVVLGAPLTIDADSLKTASGDIGAALKTICDKVHGYGDVPVRRGREEKEIIIGAGFCEPGLCRPQRRQDRGHRPRH